MIRGTTPTHTFNLPFGVETIKEVRITYQQDNNTVIEKTEADCTKEGQRILVKLTQEETLQFTEGKQVSIQLKVLTTSNDVLVSQIAKTNCGKALNEEVLE